MRFGLVMSEVGQGLRRNISMVISVILVTFISLTFVGAAILLQMQIGQMKGYWYDRAQVAVYMCNGFATTPACNGTAATEEQVAQVQQLLDSPTLEPYIERVELETQQQAYENFQTQYAGNAIADIVTPEYMNQTFWVNLVDPTKSAVIRESLAGQAGVEQVQDLREYLDPILSALNAASYTAIGIAVLMLVAAVLLIATTIRLSAFSRRRELGIMRLVGASNRFIQTPFILEGVFAALIGSVLAGAAITLLVRFFVQGYLSEQVSQTQPFVSMDDALIVVPILFVIGILLAALSANVAIRRYLKV
ncbi:MAG TPA: permease-like cell division protein FtsX [Microbacterium sp.]|uniref:Cell division protein FtsX n=1 Tax=Diaminobutyricimonas aerilata TaxID=1162967 RepID=A0A2M9CLM2_9MICO|nr:permease-like cell division protein FtsX [Diaminobutyricimonas aerilata]PJJ72805.1 cell division transport system permease protein [Diaminobutyricimonas aerilata]HWS52263.1 permease-like cell division protein FtsX [Microbacterium sp.]